MPARIGRAAVGAGCPETPGLPNYPLSPSSGRVLPDGGGSVQVIPLDWKTIRY